MGCAARRGDSPCVRRGLTNNSRSSAGPGSAEGVEVSIAWAGDITPGSSYGLPPDDGRGLFENVRDEVIGADVAIGNLEGTFSVGDTSKCETEGGDCFSFQAPPENAAALAWAGFDLLNLANMVRRRGLRIATVGFAPYPWATDLRDLDAVAELVRRASDEADLVVVLAHLGAEGSGQIHTPVGRERAMGEDRGDTRAFAHVAVDAGADLVLASGPHVLRGIELRNGKLIAYSLGNFAGWHNFSTAGALSLSGLLTVRLSPDGYLRGGSTHRPAPERRRGAVRGNDRRGGGTRQPDGKRGLRRPSAPTVTRRLVLDVRTGHVAPDSPLAQAAYRVRAVLGAVGSSRTHSWLSPVGPGTSFTST